MLCSQAVAYRDARIAEQHQQLEQLRDHEAAREREQQQQLNMLVSNFEAMRASCEQQVWRRACVRPHVRAGSAAGVE